MNVVTKGAMLYSLALNSWNGCKLLKDMDKQRTKKGKYKKAFRKKLRRLNAYFSVLALMYLYEQSVEVFVSWVPFYYVIKLLLIMACHNPYKGGPEYLFNEFIKSKFASSHYIGTGLEHMSTGVESMAACLAYILTTLRRGLLPLIVGDTVAKDIMEFSDEELAVFKDKIKKEVERKHMEEEEKRKERTIQKGKKKKVKSGKSGDLERENREVVVKEPIKQVGVENGSEATSNTQQQSSILAQKNHQVVEEVHAILQVPNENVNVMNSPQKAHSKSPRKSSRSPRKRSKSPPTSKATSIPHSPASTKKTPSKKSTLTPSASLKSTPSKSTTKSTNKSISRDIHSTTTPTPTHLPPKSPRRPFSARLSPRKTSKSVSQSPSSPRKDSSLSPRKRVLLSSSPKKAASSSKKAVSYIRVSPSKQRGSSNERSYFAAPVFHGSLMGSSSPKKAKNQGK